jgi:WD40 repeat protein
VAFSQDGKQIVTGAYDNMVRVWRADGAGNFGLTTVLPGHDGPVQSAVFSEDGARIGTSSDDFTARVWRADGAGDPVVLRAHTATLYAIAFIPGTQQVITLADGNDVKIWSLSIPDLKRYMTDTNADCLLPKMLTRYFGEAESEAKDGYEACEREHGRVPTAAQSR